MKNEKEALACAILQRTSSGTTRVKWGSSPTSLHKQLSSVAGSELFGASTFNASYTDSGLFGVVLCSTPGVIGSVSNTEYCNYNNKYYPNINLILLQLTKETAKWLKSLKVSENEVARGKNVLKTEILDAADNVVCLLESLQQQALLKGQVSSPVSIANAVDKISASDVKAVCASIVSDCNIFTFFTCIINVFQVADKLAKGRLSLAAIGNLKTVPYLDELK